MRLVISVILSLFLVGCFSQSVEKVGQDIVNSLNNKQYDRIWDKYVDKDTKAQADKDLEATKNDPNTGALMLSMLEIPEDKIESLTSAELFGYIMSMADKMTADEGSNSSLVYDGVDMIDDNNAIILLQNDAVSGEVDTLKLVKINNRWYLDMSDDKSETVEEVEIEETGEAVDIVEDTEVK